MLLCHKPFGFGVTDVERTSTCGSLESTVATAEADVFSFEAWRCAARRMFLLRTHSEFGYFFL
tara:strand:- start:55 stop:243 length:189 start_codon:yes stop_codon:yes gene_type:complete